MATLHLRNICGTWIDPGEVVGVRHASYLAVEVLLSNGHTYRVHVPHQYEMNPAEYIVALLATEQMRRTEGQS